MNRRYTAEEFEKVTERLRKAYQDVILTTDIIVGFPGETDEEFEETFEFLSRIKFFKMHIFKYSIRNGTKAATMPNQILGNVKEERSKKLLELSDENEKSYLKEYVGKAVEVLFEEKSGEYYKGHTANYIMVNAKSEKDISGQILKVDIENIEGLELVGNVKEL
jgi:threonylcarbamoyladenosine tRNA methylthiotransferase MtaB